MMAPPSSFRLFSADLDGTLLGDPAATRRFKAAWEALAPRRRPQLVYNSGRLVADLRRLIDRGALPKADYYVGGVGTQIFDVARRRMFGGLRARLADGWNSARVRDVVARFPGIRAQPDAFQHEFKSSWFLKRASPAALRALSRQLAAAGLRVEIVYSSARDLDVLPRRATKGGALAWLCARLGVPLDAVLVAGDTGNDASMFRLPGVRGIVVGNALPELGAAADGLRTYASRKVRADGVLDGLRHYGVLGARRAGQRIGR